MSNMLILLFLFSMGSMVGWVIELFYLRFLIDFAVSTNIMVKIKRFTDVPLREFFEDAIDNMKEKSDEMKENFKDRLDDRRDEMRERYDERKERSEERRKKFEQILEEIGTARK